MMNIVIPMAGLGSRFSKVGYPDPKPLIPVLGKPMIQRVIENLRPSAAHRFIFICQSAHLRSHALRALLEAQAPGCKIIEVQQVTQGAACTVLLAKEFIDNADPLMIANCDQYIEADIDEYLRVFDDPSIDGLIMTMKAHDEKWSFVGFDAEGRIDRVVEKKVVSDEATVGIYNYRHGRDFVGAAQRMIDADLRVNNEFYVAPAYNEMLAKGKKLAFYNIGSLGFGMHGLGTPEDLQKFIEKPPRLP